MEYFYVATVVFVEPQNCFLKVQKHNYVNMINYIAPNPYGYLMEIYILNRFLTKKFQLPLMYIDSLYHHRYIYTMDILCILLQQQKMELIIGRDIGRHYLLGFVSALT